MGVIPAPAPHRPFSDRSYPLATEKFTPTDINKAIKKLKLPKATRGKIPKIKESQTAQSLLGKVGKVIGSVPFNALLLALTSFPAVKDGGKIYKKKKPARKVKIAKVMKRKTRKT